MFLKCAGGHLKCAGAPTFSDSVALWEVGKCAGAPLKCAGAFFFKKKNHQNMNGPLDIRIHLLSTQPVVPPQAGPGARRPKPSPGPAASPSQGDGLTPTSPMCVKACRIPPNKP